MINSGSSFKFLSTNLQKSKLKYKVLGFLITTIFYSMYDSVIIMAWLNCCKLIWLYYYADTKDALFVWFPLLVFLNYFRLLYVLMILVAWLIVCFNPSPFFTSSSLPSSGGMGGYINRFFFITWVFFVPFTIVIFIKC